MALYNNRLSIDELAQATTMQRIVFELVCDSGLTHDEIAPLIGAKSGKAVSMRLYRLRKRLGLKRQPAKKTRGKSAYFGQLSVFEGL